MTQPGGHPGRPARGRGRHPSVSASIREKILASPPKTLDEVLALPGIKPPQTEAELKAFHEANKFNP